MDQKQKISPLMRVLAGLLAIGCAFILFQEFVARRGSVLSSIGDWVNLVFVSSLLLLCLHFFVIGRSPLFFE